MQRLAEQPAPGPPEPLYLRRPDARVPGQPKRVTPMSEPGARRRHEGDRMAVSEHGRAGTMTSADLEAVLGLEHDLFGEEAWSRQMLEGELAQQQRSRYYLVADDGGWSPATPG